MDIGFIGVYRRSSAVAFVFRFGSEYSENRGHPGMIRFDKFTLKAQEAIEQSQQVAGQREHQQITPLHLLVSLASQPDGVVQPVLEKLKVSPDTILMEADRALNALPRVKGAQQANGQMFLTPG
jgi:ATP-dependent Clp protease ATP-binding subunit ClpB